MVFPNTELDLIVEVYLGADPTADPDTWPAATDFSSRLLRLPIPITRGRRPGQRTLSAGSCVLWLDNTDGALTPTLATSTYYPDWDLGVPVRLSVDNVGLNPPYVRFAGFAADISMVMVPGAGGANISAVRVTLGGAWRRISQGAVTKSPLLRTILGKNQVQPIAYWPCEDEQGATQIASGLPSGIPMTMTGTVTPNFTAGQITGSRGALDLSNLGAAAIGAAAIGATIPLPSSAGFQLEYSFYTEVTTDPSELLFITCGTFGATMAGAQTLADGDSHHTAVKFVQNGANVDVTVYRDGVFSSTTPLAGVLSTSLTITNADPATTEAVQVAHIAVYGFDDMGVSQDRADAADGFLSEQAHTRIARVCGEEGIAYSGTATQSNEVGPQPVADITEVLADAEAIDHGILFEDLNFGFGYRASSQRENLAAALTIDLSTYRTTRGTQGDVLTPVRNDARIRNEWTISRPDGSNATAKDETSQAKKGRYNDSATVNVEDDTRILDEAQWRVHEGTFDGLRYQTVPLDIAANQY